MPTVITQGAASAKGYGFGARATAANYIEDVFSTYLYASTGASQTITNAIDLSTKGGLVWIKGRDYNLGVNSHVLTDTERGATKTLSINTGAEVTNANGLTAFNTNGFTIGNLTAINPGYGNFVSWSFRKQAKFFDVVVYTGNGAGSRTINHNLASTPGCIIVKSRNASGDPWYVYHRSLGTSNFLSLNTTDASTAGSVWGSPSSSSFTVTSASNSSGTTYVAYLFAHDAGGFGAAGTDNVISCGSFTTNASGIATVTLGYEPQWVLIKRSNSTGSWHMLDTMRGFSNSNDAWLMADSSAAENSSTYAIATPTATGFVTDGTSVIDPSSTFIYIAIRRGPMKTPTSGTSVFGLNARTGTGANATVTGGQTDDAVLIKNRGSVVGDLFAARLTGTGYLETSSTAAEVAAGTTILQANPWDVMDGVKVGTTSTITNASSNTFINYLFRRAPGFFDQVCYTSNNTNNRSISHNLGVAPELAIFKVRNNATNWFVAANLTATTLDQLLLNSVGQATNNTYGITTYLASKPTSTTISVNASGSTNNTTTYNFVAYLFATCPNVSKVGSYTGNGTSQTINCGFTGGARFVLIKRTDSTGDWYVWDTARGIVAGNDPRLSLNTIAAEVTTDDSVDTASSGFIVNQLIATNINVNAATYIFLAIA